MGHKRPTKTELQKEKDSPYRPDVGSPQQERSYIAVGKGSEMNAQNVEAIGHHKKLSHAAEQAIAADFDLSEIGFALRLQILNEGNVRYVTAWKTWIVFNEEEMTWERKSPTFVHEMLNELSAMLKKESRMVMNSSGHAFEYGTGATKAYSKAMNRLGNKNTRQNAVYLFRTLPGVATSPDELDRHTMKLGCLNGVLDLRTQEMVESPRDLLITKKTSVPYSPKAKCKRWKKFISEIFCEDEEMIGFIQRVLGYALTGDNREQYFFILYGEAGSNGKSTFIEAVNKIMGDYALSTPDTTFVDRKQGSLTNDLARLNGSRLVMASESADRKPLSGNLVKQVTGNDSLTVRFLNQEFFTYIPQYTVFFLTNHRPRVSGGDEALWRRLAMVEFKRSFTDQENPIFHSKLAEIKYQSRKDQGLIQKKDYDLASTLAEEREGILAWMVEGAKMWLKEKRLVLPKAVHEAREAYRGDMDVLFSFLLETVEFTDGTNTPIKNSELWECWQDWAIKNNEKVGSKRWLGIHMKKRGFLSVVHNGSRVWTNIALKTEGV